MAQPLYFLPGLSRSQLLPGGKLSRALLRERGLSEVFEDVGIGREDFGSCELAGRGPGGKSGIILFYQRPDGSIPRRIDYRPAEQSWTAVDPDGLWIGLDTDDPPTPEDLARHKQHLGYTIELADGHTWRIPVIRRPDGSTELPTELFWDAAGKITEPLKERYRAYWDETAEVAGWFFEGKSADFDKGKALGLAVRALSLNYRFGRAEQNVFKVADTLNYLTILAATVDMPKVTAIDEAEKKSASQLNTPNSTPGSVASGEAIDLAGAT